MESDKSIAIKYPIKRPHWVIVPKRDIKDMGTLAKGDEPYVIDTFAMIGKLARDAKLKALPGDHERAERADRALPALPPGRGLSEGRPDFSGHARRPAVKRKPHLPWGRWGGSSPGGTGQLVLGSSDARWPSSTTIPSPGSAVSNPQRFWLVQSITEGSNAPGSTLGPTRYALRSLGRHA